jgi:hypothetical protein
MTTAALDYSCGVYGVMSVLQLALGEHDFPTRVTDFEAFNEPNGATQGNSLGGGFNGILGTCQTTQCEYDPSTGMYTGNPTMGYPHGPCGSEYFTVQLGGGSQATEINDCGGETNSQLGNTNSLCGSSAPGTPCGETEATMLWIIAQFDSQAYFGGDGFKIAAMTLSDAQNSSWEDGYLSAMYASMLCLPGEYCNPGLTYPTVWGVHDYDDVTAPTSGPVHGDISSFLENLASNWGSGQQVWITEAATDLNSRTNSDDNPRDFCNVGTYGECIDGNPFGQMVGGESFVNLPSASGRNTITQTDWYELEAPNPSSGFDSGLLAPGAPEPTQPACEATGNPYQPGVPYCVPSGGSYSGARQSLCQLDQIASTYCSSSTIDASDWDAADDN